MRRSKVFWGHIGLCVCLIVSLIALSYAIIKQAKALRISLPDKFISYLQKKIGIAEFDKAYLNFQQLEFSNLTLGGGKLNFPMACLKLDTHVGHYLLGRAQHTLFLRHGHGDCGDQWHISQVNGFVETCGRQWRLNLHALFNKTHAIHVTSELLSEFPSYVTSWGERFLQLLSGSNQGASAVEPAHIHIHLGREKGCVRLELQGASVSLDPSSQIVCSGGQIKMIVGKQAIDVKGKISQLSYGDYILSHVYFEGQLTEELDCKGIRGYGEIAGPLLQHLSGTSTIAFTQKGPLRNSAVNFLLENEKNFVQGFGKFTDFKWTQCMGRAVVQAHVLPEHFGKIPDYLNFQRPIYLKFSTKDTQLYCLAAETRHLCVDSFCFDRIFLRLNYDLAHGNVKWSGRAKEKNIAFNSQGRYDGLLQQGRLFLQGEIDPQLTYLWATYLPQWWIPFWRCLRFFDRMPTFNLDFDWDELDESHNALYATVTAQQFLYKQANCSNLALKIGYIPHYICLDARRVETKEGRGLCAVDWLYNDLDQDAWSIRGQGVFPHDDWQSLVGAFIDNVPRMPFVEHASPIRATFNGRIYNHMNAMGSVRIALNTPSVSIYNVPLSHLSAHIHYIDQQWDFPQWSCKLAHNAAMEGQMSFRKDETFSFKINAQEVPSAVLLRRLDCLQSWVKDLQQDDLSSYEGILAVDAMGEGHVGKLETLTAKGKVKFKNPSLAKIHLLGPLFKIFSKKLSLFTSVDLNYLASKFYLKNSVLTSKGLFMTGPSTHVKGDGEINLLTQQLKAQLNFSFLDYKQVKFPVMREFVQILQPFLKGFGAQLSGSFQNPQWQLSFNPLNFLLK